MSAQALPATTRTRPEAGSLVELLDIAAASPHGIDCVDAESGESLGYAALRARARAFAWGLRRRGIARGDRVALLLPNTLAFPTAYFGSLMVGAVPVPLPPPVPFGRVAPLERRTAHVLADCSPRLLVHAGNAAPHGVEAADVGALCADGGGRSLPHRARGDDTALIQYTSGSTSRPRGVVLTHGHVLRNVAAIVGGLRWQGEERSCSWLPLFHDMGLIGGLLVPLSQGGRLALLRPEQFLLDPGVWLRTLSERRCTLSVAPNFAYAYAAHRMRRVQRAGLDLSSWRVALCGGEPIQAQDLAAFEAAFGPHGFRPQAWLPCYGLAEATLAVSFADAAEPPRRLSVDGWLLAERGRIRVVRAGAGRTRRLVSCGRPLPGVEVRIRRDDRDQPEDRVGGIEVRGPSVMRGYLGQDEATARALDGGWLRTGDLGFVHAGELYVTGRQKDLIIVRGRNCYPEDAELVAEAVAGVRRGSAVAIAAAVRGTQSLALVAETAERGAAALARLAVAVRREVAAGVGIQPAEIVLCPERSLPKTSSGKRQRSLTRAQLADGCLVPLYRLRSDPKQGGPS